MTLRNYKKKRDFRKTTEPSGEKESSAGNRIFVIQKHDATNLHYDVRIEIDGVLVSWAVPKGPSTDPEEKRLAIRTEDHPIAYSNFEGVISEDQYGAGVVMVWDKGTYGNMREEKENESVSMKESLKDGKIEINLNGEKLSGGYYLIRTGTSDGDEQWLLIKADDDEADARRNPTSTEPESVLSGKTLEEIKEEYEQTD